MVKHHKVPSKGRSKQVLDVTVFWIVTLCTDEVGYQHSEWPHCPLHFNLKMEAARSSKMLVSHITTQNHNPEDRNLKSSLLW